MTTTLCLLAVVSSFSLMSVASCAPEPSQSGAMFPFVIPWDDATPGTANDVSWLNEAPAGKNGFVVVKNGRFIESNTGKRLRFLGTNMGAAAAFPQKVDADKIAARLAKMGINIVRFHHLQNDWDREGGMIWKQGREHVEFDPRQVDRLDYFIFALKKRGIYSNINLSTTRKYQPEQGFPQSVLELNNMGGGFSFCKKVDKFNRRMIELQKDYARQLLDRVNPYTKLKYKDDPAIAVIEINNENSLVGWPGESPGAGLDNLPEPFRGELVAFWNKWLAKEYGDDEKLQQAWKAGQASGPNLIPAETRWTHENQSNADLTFDVGTRTSEGPAPIRASIRSTIGPNWHIQAHLGGLTLKDGLAYTLKFRARSDKPRGIGITCNLDKPDWHSCGLGGSVRLESEWRDYVLSFVASATEPGHVRIAFVLGDAASTVEISDVRLLQGIESVGLLPGESMAKGTVALSGGGLSRRSQDFARFLVDTEAAYSNEMMEFLRKDLGFRANLIDTQINWGGLTSFVRERAADFADSHAYWQHPTFLGSDWDPKHWIVNRRAMANEMVERCGELGSLALLRLGGKPFTVSEYDHPAPNDYRVEMMPMYSTFGAFQDWDILYTFAYPATGTGRPNDRVDGFFDVGTDPAVASFYAASALVFRLGLVPAATSTLVLFVPNETPWQPSFTHGAAWGVAGAPVKPLEHKYQVRQSDVRRPEFRSEGKPSASPIKAAGTPKGVVYTVDTPGAKVLTGFVGGSTVALTGLTATFGGLIDGFASLMLVGQDGKPVAQSKRTLLTVVGRVENQNMGWNENRTSVGDQWGHGPVLVERIEAKLVVKRASPSKVYELDATGKRVRTVPSGYSNGNLTFTIGKGASTLWYEIANSGA